MDTFLTESTRRWQDMLAYDSFGLSQRTVQRIFAARGPTANGGLGYCDFVRFMISEEGKDTNAAAHYWFQLLDFDGDGKVVHLHFAHRCF